MGTFLVQNYRSHKKIFELSSVSFYRTRLQERAPLSKRKNLDGWELLPNEHCPVMFVGVNGRHAHTIDSPSFYNEVEMYKVLELVTSLLLSTAIQPRVNQDEIFVICAFRAQVLRVRSLLRDNNFGNISVGQVEDYQGQERR
jgi:superfamily I DNA and/or RNA helicase